MFDISKKVAVKFPSGVEAMVPAKTCFISREQLMDSSFNQGGDFSSELSWLEPLPMEGFTFERVRGEYPEWHARLLT